MNFLTKILRVDGLNFTTKFSYSSAVALNSFRNHLNEQLDGIKKAGTYKSERVIVTKQGSRIKVAGNHNEILNFCANNYLGLSVSFIKLILIEIFIFLRVIRT